GIVQQADHLQVLLDDVVELGHDRGHVHAAGLEVAAARIEHGFQFLDQEGDVAALAEHRGHDSRQRHDPLEVVHILRVDEDLEGTAQFEFGAGVEHDVVDSDVQRVLEQRRFDRVGGADQGVRTLHLLVHLDHFGHDRLGRVGLLRFRCGNGRVGLDDLVAGDLLVDFRGHVLITLTSKKPRRRLDADAGVGVLRSYLRPLRPPFFAPLRAPPFFAAFFAPFLAPLRAPPFFAAFLAPFLAPLRAPPFFAAFLADFLAGAFFAAFLAPPFLAAFFAGDFLAGAFLAGAAGAAAGASAIGSLLPHGNVVSLLIGGTPQLTVDFRFYGATGVSS